MILNFLTSPLGQLQSYVDCKTNGLRYFLEFLQLSGSKILRTLNTVKICSSEVVSHLERRPSQKIL